LFGLGVYDELEIAAFIELTKSWDAISISLVFFKEIFKFVWCFKMVEKFSQLTGPFESEVRGGLQVIGPYISRMTGVWSDKISQLFWILCLVFFGIEVGKKSSSQADYLCEKASRLDREEI